MSIAEHTTDLLKTPVGKVPGKVSNWPLGAGLYKDLRAHSYRQNEQSAPNDLDRPEETEMRTSREKIPKVGLQVNC
jgi:hypothetical protein